MAVHRKPGSIEDHLDKALHVLSDADLESVGMLRNTLAKQSNPNQAARLTLEDAAKLDALLSARGYPAVFVSHAKAQVEAILSGLRRETAPIPLDRRMLHLCAEVGDLTGAVTRAMEDGRLELHERRNIAREAQEVIDRAVALRDAVEPPAQGDVVSIELVKAG
ncbi:phage regulatory CII family protein [Niveispirillum cyanobacteriorum]|uniref:Uncharacterized protein n=1 Tax=Niveispirillum cyanobacteriorum TaxID=1612173 RepID=A0A2K9NI47_9PROT|nr:phage regulatory CII family protein [Niveispirillum cyanobacteriorum]AUN31975.1 hypothetical protein C0V82_16225 [Niveispirillum cyanobacteriorum]GGE85263.1 hypothetical protein GCM10011317_48100 [Niveispirillum cyanobacteriorum]